MKPKARILKLFLKNGTLDGFFNVVDTNTTVSVYSCPRDSINELFEEDAIDGWGVYFLISETQVYVGQSTNLRNRIDQHTIGKPWWQKVVLVTTTNDNLNRTSIDYLESEFIKMAESVGSLDIDNKTKGVKQKIDRFDQTQLNIFIEDSLILLELIGVNVFKKSTENKFNTIIKGKSDLSESELQGILKREVISFLKTKQIELPNNVSYGKLQESKNWFWVNPDVSFLSTDWTLILNNQVEKKITIIRIPKNTFKASLEKIDGFLILRKDKPNYIDLNISAKDFIDQRSKIEFKNYIKEVINY
jgi:hypothetical protein